jgi:hypothetical protein
LLFVHNYKYSQSKRRALCKKALKTGKIQVKEKTPDGNLYIVSHKFREKAIGLKG